MKSKSPPALSSHRRGFSFYEKAAGMLMAAGAATTTADAAIVSWEGSGVIDTGNLAPGGNLVSLQLIGTTNGSVAYGFVKGIGNLSLPSDSLAGFFRAASAPTVGAGNGFGPAGGQLGFNYGPLLNNAQFSGDNLFAFSFTSTQVNNADPVYGWARLFMSETDPIDGARITAWAYDDTGAPLQLGTIPEPSGLALLAAGAAGGVACFHRFRNRRRQENESAAD